MPTATLYMDSTPHTEDFDLVAGNTLTTEIAVQLAGTDKDLSDATVTFQVFDANDDPVYVSDAAPPVSDPVEITPTGTNHNVLYFPMTSAVTAGWSGTYCYRFDCVFAEADPDWPGDTRTLVTGAITVRAIPS